MEMLITYAVAIILVVLVVKILGKSLKIIFGVLANALIGGVIIWLLNLLGFGIALNYVTALLVGFLGIPGVVIVLILQFLF